MQDFGAVGETSTGRDTNIGDSARGADSAVQLSSAVDLANELTRLKAGLRSRRASRRVKLWAGLALALLATVIAYRMSDGRHESSVVVLIPVIVSIVALVTSVARWWSPSVDEVRLDQAIQDIRVSSD